MNDEKVVQFRFFEDNPSVVKECQGWQPWETIPTEAKLNEIRDYIQRGYRYQIRQLTQTHTEGLCLVGIAIAPNLGGPGLDREIVPSLEAIRRYLIDHDMLPARSEELGFTLRRGSTHGVFWSKATFVIVDDKPVAYIGQQLDLLWPDVKLYTRQWKESLDSVREG